VIGDTDVKRTCQAILFAFLGLSAVAQEAAAPRVLIPLIASGSHHRPTSITVESLVITDQRTPVIGASLLHGADLPLELGVLVDTSNSQRDAHLEDFVKTSKQFADDVIRGPEDRVFFLKFSMEPQATGWLNKDQLQGTTAKVEVGGGTALYDAVAVACRQRMGPRDWRKPTRRVLVLISDGEDNLSHITRSEAISEALKVGTVIFTIYTKDSGLGDVRGKRVMENLAKFTAGESFSDFGTKNLPKVFATIREQIDGMYYLSYVPPNNAKSAVHEVEVKPAPKEKFELMYPRTYFWDP
jgi:Ca-activated chloride channel family protein